MSPRISTQALRAGLERDDAFVLIDALPQRACKKGDLERRGCTRVSDYHEGKGGGLDAGCGLESEA